MQTVTIELGALFAKLKEWGVKPEFTFTAAAGHDYGNAVAFDLGEQCSFLVFTAITPTLTTI